jgi:hypothetical protein
MKNKKPISVAETFLALSDEEKERQFREFDKEFIADSFKPLPPAQRKLWKHAKAKNTGRPRVGRGAKIISVSIERGLLKEVDAEAKSQGISRSELFARGWRKMINGKKK